MIIPEKSKIIVDIILSQEFCSEDDVSKCPYFKLNKMRIEGVVIEKNITDSFLQLIINSSPISIDDYFELFEIHKKYVSKIISKYRDAEDFEGYIMEAFLDNSRLINIFSFPRLKSYLSESGYNNFINEDFFKERIIKIIKEVWYKENIITDTLGADDWAYMLDLLEEIEKLYHLNIDEWDFSDEWDDFTLRYRWYYQ